jgi:ribokinase
VSTASEVGRGIAVGVVGSVNLDLVATVERHPAPGETVISRSYEESLGGKGLNQVLAAANLASSALVAVVGDDPPGRAALATARARGIDTRAVMVAADPTGRAFVTVDATGENMIVVVPAANSRLTPEQVHSSLTILRPHVVLTQLEIPEPAVVAASAWSSRAGVRFVLNGSPVARIPESVLEACDPLVVNKHEAAELCERLHLPSSGQPEALAKHLFGRCGSVVVTAGADGAVAAAGEDVVQVSAERVPVVDTTGAGDEFLGVLSARLARGELLPEAVRAATKAASALVGRSRADR